MSGQIQRPIELFDEVRGDILSISREDFVEIYEYEDPDFFEIMRGLGAFFVGNKGDPEPEIKARDKRNIGVIKRLIDHQKVNAMRELKRKKAAFGAANSRWNDKAQNANACERMRKDTDAVDKGKGKDKDKVKRSLSFPVRENKAPADAALVSLDSVEDAKRQLMILAPPVDGEHYSEDDIDYWNDLMPKNEKDAVIAVMNTTKESKAGDERRKFSANTYRKFYHELGHDLFGRAYFRFSTDLANEDEKYGNSDDSSDLSKYPEDAITRNPAKVFTARLKRLMAMKSVIVAAS